MKIKFENLIIGLIALGMFGIMLSIPSILTSLPLWVTGLFGFIILFIWLFASVGAFSNYFIDIYKSDGLKGIKKEIIFWLPALYFLGSVILFFQKSTYLIGIILFVIGVIYVLYMDQKKSRKK